MAFLRSIRSIRLIRIPIHQSQPGRLLQLGLSTAPTEALTSLDTDCTEKAKAKQMMLE